MYLCFMEEDYIRLIFGLKLRQIRNEKDLSLFGLSKLTGLSKSYLNEIENGKKYPKPDKIVTLSEKLEVPYDQLVSLKLDKNLAPVGDLLQSKVLKEIPLELFGIKEGDLIEIVANAPIKVNAFISTIFEIAKNYNFSRENFYLASLRSYQEANNNYFEELEEAVLRLAKTYQIDLRQFNHTNVLEEVLREEFGYNFVQDELDSYEDLHKLRSVFVPSSSTLLLSNKLSEPQRNFILAKELGFNFLKTKDRLLTFPWIRFDRFDQVLHNFYASYFAGALIVPYAKINQQLKQLFAHDSFDAMLFNDIINSFNASPESFYQRLTNVLPKEFSIKDLFFLRFSHKKSTEVFHLTKEMHLTNHQSPRANETNEHYCRRWVSIKVLENLERSNAQHEFDLQISDYKGDNSTYLVISSATKDPFKMGYNRSFSIGLLINKQLKKKLNFLADPKIRRQTVGVSCERCAIENCAERVASPKFLNKSEIDQKLSALVESLNQKYKTKK